MKAMVMAAGAGTRLQPLTFSVPKPLVPIANRPVLEYTLDNLRRHGIRDLVLNLHSHPELIKNHFKNGAAWGVCITYSHEPKLLGTAGGVRKAAPFLQGGTFLVISGDGLTDIDLTKLLAAHRRRRAEATIALKSIESRLAYGVALTGAQGRITRFVEKPHWGEVFSNQANTGIYVLEPEVLHLIPPGRSYDFGHDLWPKLLKNKARIFGQEIGAYWCDVGNLNEYRRAQKDALDGKVRLSLPGRQVRKRVWVDTGAQIERDAVLEAPCLIGRNARIGRGAKIGPYTVIGHNARIGKNARLRHCTLWNDVQVGDHVTLENCIIGHGARVTESISLYEGTVINAKT
jgi:mannose-1-phosphate guanylyltransferase/phosphomannomutase